MLERILYVSRAAPGVCFEDVRNIIRTSYARNAALGITGALICLDGWFVQLLEGPADGLDALYGRISSDRCHMDPSLRIQERALCRLFPGHAMALRTRSGLDSDWLDETDYRPGFPVEEFPAALLTEFMVCAFHRRAVVRPMRCNTVPAAATLDSSQAGS